MSTFKLEIVTPEQKAFETEAEEVILPTSAGQIAVLAGHENLITQIIPGELTVKYGGKQESFAAGEGFARITPKYVSIITDLAAASESIVEAEVEEAKKAAEEALKQKSLSDEEYAIAAANLQKALAQLKIKRRRRN